LANITDTLTKAKNV